MTTDRFLRFEFALPHGTPDWQHWADEPASQLIEELREASSGGRYRVRALEADGTVVAELPVPTPQPGSTDELLATVRRHVVRPWKPGTPAHDMAAAMLALDGRLVAGDPLPRAWQR